MGTGALRSLPTLVKFGQWLYQKWRPEKHTRVLAQLADDLAGAVYRAEGKLQQELRALPGSGSFMPVMFTATDLRRPGDTFSAEVDDIADYFDLLENPRRMVVLGEPGAGKTVTATYLVRGLIQHRREVLPETLRGAVPVPVRVNTAGWDGGQQFSTWLTNRLHLDYKLPTALGAEMLDSGMILPVLDGLDEMDDESSDGARARALLDRLNNNEWTHRPVVVLCRSSEFAYLRQVGGDSGLHGATTVTLDPLPTGSPVDHLTGYQTRIEATHPAWNQLTTHLREHTDSPLATTLRNPWMLGLTATALHHTPHTAVALLDCSTPEAVRDRLFAAQIPAAISGTHDTERLRDYTPDNVEKWLRTLARHLEHRRETGGNGTAIRLDEIWEMAGTTRARFLHGLTATLLSGLLLGLILGLTAWFGGGLVVGLAIRLTVGVTVGVAGGLVIGLVVGLPRNRPAHRIAWRVPARTRWRGGLAGGLVVGLVVGLAVCLMVGRAFGFWAGLAYGLVDGLAFGLAVGLVFGLETTAQDQLVMGTDARQLICNDLQAGLFYGVVFGLVAGLGFGLAGGLVFGLVGGLGFGLAGGLVFGLVFGPAFGLVSVRFALSALLFKITAGFPARPATFLAWAHDSGLLRVNAAAYQFRHQTYQQWLLHHPSTTDPCLSPDNGASVAPLSP
ncbi:NACHT domain-containing protein [Nocardia thailandica]